MNQVWKKHTHEEIKKRVFSALSQNVHYGERSILGVPASYLDDKVFSQDVSFLENAPYISTLVQNPNHIGCHTLGKSESFFKGTQVIEKELIEICAVDIMKGQPGRYDGYVASGGTEANIQAIWVLRNYFRKQFGASNEEISILCTKDTHYSVDKTSNLLGIGLIKVGVEDESRTIDNDDLTKQLHASTSSGNRFFIVIANMMTTMFGSVDDVSIYSEALNKLDVEYRVHVDGAFGGFYYPFVNSHSDLSFENSKVVSCTLDAHKMAQAPYGTGIYLAQKGLIEYAITEEASYVEGQDYTIIGSRSGANAIAAWMILAKNGPYGWKEKIFILQNRASWLSKELSSLGIEHYRHPASNIITIKEKYVTQNVAKKYGLVPDHHEVPNWFKVVIMEHVTIEKMEPLIEDLKLSL